MPLSVKGKVTDADGLPIYNTIEVKEIPPAGSDTGIADVWAQPDGTFEILALYPDSQIEVSSYGYATQVYPANAVPAVIKLPDDPHSVINASATKKKDYTLYWVGGGLLLAAAIYSISKSKTAATAGKAATTAAKRLIAPKKVTV